MKAVINYQRIYEKLGYLFYAIAAADRVITTAEVARMHEMVERLTSGAWPGELWRYDVYANGLCYARLRPAHLRLPLQ